MFDAATLHSFRRTQEASMMHECTIEAYQVDEEGTVSYGEPVSTVCGFKALSYSGRDGGTLYDTVQADGEVRLPLSVSIGMHDRVTLTASFGTALDPVRHYEVCELPDSFGPSGHVVRVKEVYL